jgi:phosphatidylglycerophosphate synthase
VPQLLLMTTRDWLMLPMMAAARLLPPETRARLTLRSNYFGKATTVSQFFALVSALAWPAWLQLFAILSAGVGVLSVASYAARGCREAFGGRPAR